MAGTISIGVRLNETVVSMMKEIAVAKGFSSNRSVIEQAVRDMHAKVFPIYAQTKRRPEGSAQSERDADEEREQAAICRKLEGSVEEEDGANICVYFNYHKKKRLQQRVPFDRLSNILVRNQYFPSREAVEALQSENKVDYV